jgi:hypothetical protein
MSMSQYTYIGTIIEVQADTVFIECEENVCSSCSKIISTPFCPNCGGAQIRKTIGYEQDFDVMDLLCEAEIDDRFSVLGDSSNYIGIDADKHAVSISSEDEDYYEMPTPAPKEILNDLLLLLEKNKIKYSVKFGIFSYYT